MRVKKEDIGKKVTFRAATRWGNDKATRVIKNVNAQGNAEVRFGGWGNFIVRPHEIIEVHREV